MDQLPKMLQTLLAERFKLKLHSAAKELPFNGVYRIKDGTVTLLASDEKNPAEFPNGIVFSPDEKFLYVTAGFGKTLRYEVTPDGGIRNGKLFVAAGNDGMKVDTKGNLYITETYEGKRVQRFTWVR